MNSLLTATIAAKQLTGRKAAARADRRQAERSLVFDYVMVGQASPVRSSRPRWRECWGRRYCWLTGAATSAATLTITRWKRRAGSQVRAAHLPHQLEGRVHYLSRFTQWRDYEHRVLASVEGKLVPIPINLDTVNRLYGLKLTGSKWRHISNPSRKSEQQIRTSEDVFVSRVGRDLYEKMFRSYTRKQWGLDPSELDASVTARIPVRRIATTAISATPIRRCRGTVSRACSRTCWIIRTSRSA